MAPRSFCRAVAATTLWRAVNFRESVVILHELGALLSRPRVTPAADVALEAPSVVRWVNTEIGGDGEASL
jgi:hypothetical protein